MVSNSFIEFRGAYDDVPWYRRRWFMVLAMLLFAPAVVIIAATGDIYAFRNDRVYVYSPTAKRSLIFCACVLVALGLWRVFKPD